MMRRLAYPAAVLLLVASATVANAGAGLPKLGTFEAGSYKAAVHIDSQVPHMGTNVVTIESSLPSGAHVELTFIGPKGQTVNVPLKPLTVLTGPEGGHGEEAAGDHAAATDEHAATTDDHAAVNNDHGAATDNHAAPKVDDHAAAAQADAHDATPAAATGYNARGRAKLDQTGHWTAVLVFDGVPEGKLTAKVPFEVEQGGPNRIFLAFSGLLMGGTIVYGAINRRSGAKNGR